MTGLQVPIVVVVLGEGGSGGALAIGVGDAVLALENSVYSVISPEGCASSILWRSRDEAQVAAAAMRMTAADQLELGVVDAIIAEPEEGAQHRSRRHRTGGQGRDHRPPAARRARATRQSLLATRYARLRSHGSLSRGGGRRASRRWSRVRCAGASGDPAPARRPRRRARAGARSGRAATDDGENEGGA